MEQGIAEGESQPGQGTCQGARGANRIFLGPLPVLHLLRQVMPNFGNCDSLENN